MLVFSAFYIPGYKGGGPIKTVSNLVNCSDGNIEFKVITSDRDLGDLSPYSSVVLGGWNRVGKSFVFYSESGVRGYKQIVREMVCYNYDIIYLNSFFSIRFSLFPLLIAKLLRKRIVLGPRGEFSEGALTLKKLKKRIFIIAFRVLGFHKKVLFQASSDFEANDIRRVLGKGTSIYVAPDIGTQAFAKNVLPRTSCSLMAVFVSRISPMKNLLGALQILKRVHASVVYDIYGPIEDYEYWRQCENVISELPPHITVTYKGELKPDLVLRTMIDYDVFFMPTKGENYSHVITEAFCAGLPVLIANTTPWRDLKNLGVGWDFPLNNPDAFSAVLDELANLSPKRLLEMRMRVLAWAKEKFSQGDAIEANIAMFKYASEKMKG